MATKCPKCNSNNLDDSVFCAKCGTQIKETEAKPLPTQTIEAPIEELTTGSTFAGRYQIIEELGKGGMGKVYKVLDKEVKAKIALKLIKHDIASDKKTIERFRNELKTARDISHKNICRMYDLNKEEGSYYITMEYVSGEDLKSFIRRARRLDIGTAITIAKQVCDGLAEAHRLEVIHRDLKPSNVMIDKEGNARIMDFGIARSLESKGITGAGVMIGTPEYMSPEQVEGKEVDQRSDIYSLGVILYEMVTGRVPFEGDTALTIAVKQKTEEPKDPRELNTQLSEDISRVILKCLEKDKDKRYQSAGEIRSELTNIEKSIPTTERIVPERKPLTSKEITVTFGLKKLFVPVVVFIAIVVIGMILWRVIPLKEAVLPLEERPSIAVISFENQTGDKSYDFLQKAIPNLLISNLEQSGYLQVITWERMNDLIKQLGKERVELIDKDLGFELCQRDGIEAIVLGSFVKAGETFATDVKVLNVETKKLLKSASSRGRSVDSILETQIDELSKEISRSIGMSESKIETANLRVTDITTTSMEAYNYFLRGREDFEKYYFDEAREFLEKAVELDSTFTSAYLYLAWTYDYLGDTKARDEAYEKAKTYSEKATEKERLYIEGFYVWYIEGNPEKVGIILKQIAKKFPKEKRVYVYLGVYLSFIMRLYNESIEEFNKALELDPNYGEALNLLAYTYSDMGNFEKAIEYFQRYATVSPGDANPFDSMGEMYLMMGKLDEAIAQYKGALEIKPDFYWPCWSIGYIYALKENYSEALKWVDRYIAVASSPGIRAEGNFWKGFYRYWRGSLEQSLSDLQSAENLAEEVGNVFWKANVEWMKGWIHYDREELELSLEYNETWLDILLKYSPESASFFKSLYSLNLGFIGLKEGQIDKTKTRLAEVKALLADLVLPSEKGIVTALTDHLQAEVLLAEGFPEKAIAVCEKTLPLGMPNIGFGTVYMATYNVPFFRDVLARAYLQNGELDKAVMEYEQLITFDPNSKDRRLIHPKYHYRLAKLYEKKGQKSKAIEHYEKFLDLWKDADPGIAEVDNARERLAGMRN